jgi:hypothetical protein
MKQIVVKFPSLFLAPYAISCHISSPATHVSSPPNSSLVVSRFRGSRKSRRVTSEPWTKCGRLFRNTLVGVEAVGKLLAVLVRSVVRKHLLAGGALEGLEARLALDALRRDVLVTASA